MNYIFNEGWEWEYKFTIERDDEDKNIVNLHIEATHYKLDEVYICTTTKTLKDFAEKILEFVNNENNLLP
jgi:hypothetical protein